MTHLSTASRYLSYLWRPSSVTHCLIPPDHDWKAWNKFRVIFQDSWRLWNKGFLVVYPFLDSPLFQYFSWPVLLIRHRQWEYFCFPFLVFFLMLVKIHRLWPCLFQLVSGSSNQWTFLLVKCSSFWSRYTALLLTFYIISIINILLSFFLDTRCLSGYVQVLFFHEEDSHNYTLEAEPIEPVEQIPKCMYCKISWKFGGWFSGVLSIKQSAMQLLCQHIPENLLTLRKNLGLC